MAVVNYLPIKTENINKKPDKFTINLKDAELIFEVFYNAQGEFFSFNLFDKEENPIIYGRRIVYGVNILENIIDDRLPTNVKIIPLDKTGQAEKIGITFDNFMQSVKTYIVVGDNSD